MNEIKNYEYFQNFMKKFDYKTMDTLFPELLEAVVPTKFVLDCKGDMLSGLELRYGGAGDRRLNAELIAEHIPENTHIPRYMPHSRRLIVYHPFTGKRLGDGHGLNDWFLFEKESIMLEIFMQSKGVVLPKRLLDIIVGGIAHKIEGWGCYLAGFELKKLQNKELDMQFEKEGVDETTIIPVYTCNRRNYMAFHPVTGEKIGGEHCTEKGKYLVDIVG